MKSMYAMMAFGIGELIGSLAIGEVVDRLGNRLASWLTIASVLTQTILILLFIYDNQFGVLAISLTFFWGVQDAAANTQTQQLLGFEFQDNVRSFAVFNVAQSLFTVFVITLEAYIVTNTESYVFNSLCGILGIAMCSVTLYFPFKNKRA